MDARHRRRDIAHHHPRVRRDGRDWRWTCGCGAMSSLYVRTRRTWHQALIEALGHSTEIAA